MVSERPLRLEETHPANVPVRSADKAEVTVSTTNQRPAHGDFQPRVINTEDIDNIPAFMRKRFQQR
jgi:hypothetical protein